METKKSKSADLERRRGAFFSLGLVLGASLILMAFTYNSVEDDSVAKFEKPEGLPPDWVPEPAPPTAPEPFKPEVVRAPVIEDIEVVEDETPVEEFPFVDPTDWSPIDEPEEFPIGDPEPPTDAPDIDPTFCNGEGAMVEFIGENFNFDNITSSNGCSGTVYVSFVVEKAGSVSDVKILRGVCDEVDAEAIRVVKEMCWIPGEKAGKKVRSRFTIPISVILE